MVRLRCSEIKSEVKLFTARRLILHGHGELSRGWITPSGSLFVRSCGRVCFEQEARLWISPCRDLTFHTEGPRGRNFVVIFKPQPADLRALAQILRSRFAICLFQSGEDNWIQSKRRTVQTDRAFFPARTKKRRW